jgi:hypothetical protein
MLFMLVILQPSIHHSANLVKAWKGLLLLLFQGYILWIDMRIVLCMLYWGKVVHTGSVERGWSGANEQAKVEQ